MCSTVESPPTSGSRLDRFGVGDATDAEHGGDDEPDDDPALDPDTFRPVDYELARGLEVVQ